MQRIWLPPFQVRLTHRTRRTMVSIHPSRGLEIVTPKQITLREALRILKQHRAWIEDKLPHLKTQATPAHTPWPKQQLPEHIHLPALDEHWQLIHRPSPAPATLHIHATEQQLIFSGEPEQLWSLLQRWFISHTKAHILPKLHQLADFHADPLTGSGVRWNHSRWGSCSNAGRISLSARLLWLEPLEVNYLLHHELNHLHHFDHSPAFWQALETRLPGAKAIDRGMRHVYKRASYPAWLAWV
ncbi:MAG: YgjP-like metallopeptidase domain-containing protein [Halothiobacillaceae bacterium]